MDTLNEDQYDEDEDEEDLRRAEDEEDLEEWLESMEEADADQEEQTLDWDKASQRLNDVIEQYKELIGAPHCNPLFGLAYLTSLKTRYDSGERSQELNDEMMECE